MTNNISTIIIGGGASGLFAGSILGRKALILEKNPAPGRKLLLTGGGRCNYTHDSELPELLDHYVGERRFFRVPLYNLPPQKIVSYFEKLGVSPVIEENGKIFPSSGKAEDIVNALSAKAQIEYEANVLSISKDGDKFIINTDKGIYKADNVILATGGNSYPHTGSDGSGYKLAESFGHTIVRPMPALAPLALDYPLRDAEGITLPLEIKIGKIEMKDSAVITRRGISGPLAENISYLLGEKKDLTITFIDITKEELKGFSGKSLVKNNLPLPQRLIKALLGPLSEKKIAELKKDEINLIVERLTALKTKAIAIKEGAMSTHGGVSTKEIDSKTMESRLCPGLYLTGDLIDVDAECGGYSLTWAFATAFTASNSIIK